MNGLRITVNFSIRVGSGTGPVTVEPVRCAVSSICAADALTDGEEQALFQRDRGDKLDVQVDVVPGHDHLGAGGKGRRPGHVGGADVELGAVAVEEGGVAAALLLAEDVELGGEARV